MHQATAIVLQHTADDRQTPEFAELSTMLPLLTPKDDESASILIQLIVDGGESVTQLREFVLNQTLEGLLVCPSGDYSIGQKRTFIDRIKNTVLPFL